MSPPLWSLARTPRCTQVCVRIQHDTAGLCTHPVRVQEFKLSPRSRTKKHGPLPIAIYAKRFFFRGSFTFEDVDEA